MAIKINKYNINGEIKPIEYRICVNCSDNGKVCYCSIYAGNVNLSNKFNHF